MCVDTQGWLAASQRRGVASNDSSGAHRQAHLCKQSTSTRRLKGESYLRLPTFRVKAFRRALIFSQLPDFMEALGFEPTNR